MTILTDILTPLLKGKVVANPAALKKTQNLSNVVLAVAALVTALVPELQPYLNEDVILKLFAAYSAVNIYLTTASSEKVGL